MTTYRNIHGRSIQAVTTDPTESVAEGQVWYNTASDTFKSVVAAGATSSGSSMLTARSNAASFGNTRDASAAAAGYTGTVNTNVTEEFNGSGFSSGGNVNTTRRAARGTGSITAGLVCSGYSTAESNATEEYDGSSFTNGGNLNTSRFFAGTFGTQTAGVAAGGNQPSPAKNVTEEYNGTSWTTVPATLSNGRENHMAGGTETAGIVCGGDNATPTIQSATEEYDGSTWTAGGNLNTARAGIQGSGIQTAAIVIGGNTPTKLTSIETYNGTSWTTSPATLATARDGAHNAGTTTAAIVSGGVTPGPTTSNTTEEFNFTANTITAAAWTSSTNYPTPNSYLAGFGTTTAGVTTGGDGPPGNGITTTGEYDGSSWTTGGALGTGRRGLGAGTNSTLTAGLVFGGNDPGVPTQYSLVEEYNGSTWSEVTNLPGDQSNVGGFGTQTAGACLPVSATATLEYDGTNWTSGGSLSNPRSATLGIGCGTQTAGLAVGGSPAAPLAGDTEEYNGTAWTAGGDYFRAIQFQGTAGVQTSALISGGGPGSNTDSGTYDGTVFSTAPSMSTGREAHAGVGSAGSTSGLAVTGRSPSRTNAVEELTPESTSLNIETLTQS